MYRQISGLYTRVAKNQLKVKATVAELAADAAINATY